MARISRSISHIHATTHSKALGHRNVLAVQHIQDSSVRRLLLEIVIPQQRAALAVKSARHPAVLVIYSLSHDMSALTLYTTSLRKDSNLPKA
jgi:hypothetical protein